MVVFINNMWRFFISLRLTFVLLVTIGIGAVIGMSFDQTLTYDQFIAAKPANTVAAFMLSFFELYDTFHSWWFSLAIFLLALNLIACSIERLPRIYFDYKRPRPFLSQRRLLGLPFKGELVVRSTKEAHEVITSFMGKNAGKVKIAGRDNFYFRDAAWFGRFGVYVVHIALLIVMFSSIYATQQGVDGQILIEEGKMGRFVSARGSSGITYKYDLGFYVGCKDFRLSTFDDNSPMEFESDLFISLDRENTVTAKTVRVNEPLNYAGFTFYQSSYRPVISERTVVVEITQTGKPPSRHRLKLNEPVILDDKTVVTVEKLYEDFAGLGQALRVAKKVGAADETYFHIFRRYKDYDRLVRHDNFSLVFLDADQQYATGLSVSFMPGISVIFSGFLLFLVGLYLCFFTTPMRYYARVDVVGDDVRVVLAASGFRMQNTVKELFQQKLALLRETHHA